jgi:hypothetical protein
VVGFCDLLPPAVDPDFLSRVGVTAFASLGTSLRAQTVSALRRLLTRPSADADHIWPAAQALIDLGFGDTPEVLAAIQAAATDEAAGIYARCSAALALARLDPERIPDAVAVLRSLAVAPCSPDQWEEVVLNLARLGEDVLSLARLRLADRDTERSLRVTAASMMTRLYPHLLGEAIAELRSLAEDEHLAIRERSDAIVRLAHFDACTHDRVIAFHEELVEDDDEPVAERCWAADRLARLDRTHWPMVVATLRWLLANPRTTSSNQQTAISYLTRLKALRPNEAAHAALAVFHHPAAQPIDRRSVIARLSGPLRREAQRALLADHAAPIALRVPEPDYYRGDPPLPVETEAAVREVLTAVEFSAAGRVDAAAALASLSPRLVPEAAGILDALSHCQNRAASQALRELARLKAAWRRTALDTAHRTLADPSRPQRERQHAAEVIQDIELAPSPDALAFLRTTATDERTSDAHRIEALFALRHADGLNPLRAIRDGKQASPATRWQAATRLIDYTVDDRARSARVLDLIANDATVRPALRWRAARDLSQLGAAGRDRAASVLRTIATDDTLPVTARASAARVLAQLRTDQREAASATARELMHDATVPHHIRMHAARDLARWSQLCRQEARNFLSSPGHGQHATAGQQVGC